MSGSIRAKRKAVAINTPTDGEAKQIQKPLTSGAHPSSTSSPLLSSLPVLVPRPPLTSTTSSSLSHKRAKTTKEEQKFVCETCGQRFTRKHGLERHSVSHTGAKPYKCDECPKKFSLLSSLREHKRTHLVSHPYNCTECRKKFTDRSSLRRHMRFHTKELPFVCDVVGCGRAFARKDVLLIHSKTHTSVATTRRRATSAKPLPTPLPPQASLPKLPSLIKEEKTQKVEEDEEEEKEDEEEEKEDEKQKGQEKEKKVEDEPEAVGTGSVTFGGNTWVSAPLEAGVGMDKLQNTGTLEGSAWECNLMCDWCGSCFNHRDNWQRHREVGGCAPSAFVASGSGAAGSVGWDSGVPVGVAASSLGICMGGTSSLLTADAFPPLPSLPSTVSDSWTTYDAHSSHSPSFLSTDSYPDEPIAPFLPASPRGVHLWDLPTLPPSHEIPAALPV